MDVSLLNRLPEQLLPEQLPEWLLDCWNASGLVFRTKGSPEKSL